MANSLLQFFSDPRRRKWRFVALGVAAAVVAVALLSLGRRSTLAHPGSEYPVRGIDISAHNGSDIDFRAVKAQGYSFVIFKATEGSSFKDRRFMANIAAARRAGLKVGAYHFFRFDASGYMQALNFVHSLRGQMLDMPVVIDIEEWTNPAETTRHVLATLHSLINQLTRQGHKVMLYTNKDGYQKYVDGRLTEFPLWIASLTEFRSPTDWTLWQYTHSGKVDGITGRVDLNVFNGNENQWQQWCLSNTPLMQ